MTAWIYDCMHECMPARMNAWNACMTEMKSMTEWTDWLTEWMNAWMNEWMNACMNEWLNGRTDWMHEMNGWVNAWMNEWMTECMNARMNELMN